MLSGNLAGGVVGGGGAMLVDFFIGVAIVNLEDILVLWMDQYWRLGELLSIISLQYTGKVKVVVNFILSYIQMYIYGSASAGREFWRFLSLCFKSRTFVWQTCWDCPVFFLQVTVVYYMHNSYLSITKYGWDIYRFDLKSASLTFFLGRNRAFLLLRHIQLDLN